MNPVRLLVINPNTTRSITALLDKHVRNAAQPGAGAALEVIGATARFGAPYIACEASFAVAGHAVLDAWAAESAASAPAFDSVLIGCFGDPGLLALRDVCPSPVTGLAEASFLEASAHGRFAIVTGGARWKPMLERLAHALGHGAQLAGVCTVAPTGAQLAADPEAARELLLQACRDAVQGFGARAVIVGGAGLAGMAADLQRDIEVPLIDSVGAGARCAMARADRLRPRGPENARLFDFAWKNLSPELTALGQPPAKGC